MPTQVYKVSGWRTSSGHNPIGVYAKNKWLHAALDGEDLKDCTIDSVKVKFPALRCTFQPAGELRMKYGGVTMSHAIGSSGGAVVEREYPMSGAKDNTFSDGSGEVIFYAYQGSGEGYLSIDDAAVTVEVEYTPKASLLTVPDKRVEAGTALSFAIKPYNAAYTHKATLMFGDRKTAIDIVAGLTEGAIEVPIDWMELMPNSKELGDGQLRLDTMRDGELIGSKVVTGLTMTCAPYFLPIKSSWSFVTTVDGITYPDAGKGVQGKCGIHAEIAETDGVYGSTVTATIRIGDKTVTGAPPLSLDSGLLAENTSITFIVEDSRGFAARQSPFLIITPYEPPRASLEAWRCDALGDRDDLGTRGSYTCSYSVSPLNGENTCTAELSVAGVTEINPPESGFLLPSEGVTLDALKAYEVELRVTDLFETVTRRVRIPSSAFTLHFNAQGNGVGIGQAAEKQNAVVVNPTWDMWVGGVNMVEKVQAVETLVSNLKTTVETVQNMVEQMRPKLLWSGTWATGNQTITGIGDWQLVQLVTNVGTVYAAVTDATFMGGGFNVNESTIHRTLAFRATYSGDVCTMVASHYLNHSESSNHGQRQPMTVTAVYGLIRKNYEEEVSYYGS